MDKTSVFGAGGFILGEFCKTYPNEVEIIPRDGVFAPTKDILYGISTIHNYHPKDGNPFIDIETNLLHFMKVLKSNVSEEIVFNLISTWFVYGNTELPVKEESICNPTGFYSITARAREQLLISFAETFNIKYRILRLGNVIGIGDKKISRRKNAVQHIIKEVAQGRDVDYLYKNGAIRDYIDVRDCVNAIKLVLENGDMKQIYNVANGNGLNVNELVSVAWRESGYKSKITEIPVPYFHKTVQTPKMWMDIKKIKSLGYVQRHDIKQSVRELVHFYQDERNEKR